MCLIALSHTGFQELDVPFWEQACSANPHGLGLMYHDGAQLVALKRTTADVTAVLQLLSTLPAGRRAALHLREATAGDKGVANMHPHECQAGSQRLAVMHNGSLKSVPAHPYRGPSDTALFVAQWLPRMLAPVWHCPESMRAVADFAGERNRFVFLDEGGHWQVVGEHEGFWVGGTWLSHPRSKAWLPAKIEAQLSLFASGADVGT